MAVELVNAERKLVSAVVVDLVGYARLSESLDPEDARRLLDPYWDGAREEIERNGGTVEKFIGDAVVGLFGAPQAHEDDPVRAVRAALALATHFAAGGLRVRVGVGTGLALVDVAARPESGDALVVGDVVTTAARLQQNLASRVLTLSLAATIIVLICASRLYLGVHYPSDVFAGVVIGLAWAAFCMAVLEAAQLYAKYNAPQMLEAEQPAAKGASPSS